MTTTSTKADDVALELEQVIVSGELAPGTVLRQEQLSARYGVSRTPIREALRRLAALGLVSFGSYVRRSPGPGFGNAPERSIMIQGWRI